MKLIYRHPKSVVWITPLWWPLIKGASRRKSERKRKSSDFWPPGLFDGVGCSRSEERPDPVRNWTPKFITLQLISGKSGQHLKEGTAWNSRNVQELFHQKANGAGLRKTRRDCCYRKERNTEFKWNTKGDVLKEVLTWVWNNMTEC